MGTPLPSPPSLGTPCSPKWRNCISSNIKRGESLPERPSPARGRSALRAPKPGNLISSRPKRDVLSPRPHMEGAPPHVSKQGSLIIPVPNVGDAHLPPVPNSGTSSAGPQTGTEKKRAPAPNGTSPPRPRSPNRVIPRPLAPYCWVPRLPQPQKEPKEPRPRGPKRGEGGRIHSYSPKRGIVSQRPHVATFPNPKRTEPIPSPLPRRSPGPQSRLKWYGLQHTVGPSAAPKL